LDRSWNEVFFFREGSRKTIVKSEIVKGRQRKIFLLCALSQPLRDAQSLRCGWSETPRAIWVVSELRKRRVRSRLTVSVHATRSEPSRLQAPRWAIDVFVSRPPGRFWSTNQSLRHRHFPTHALNGRSMTLREAPASCWCKPARSIPP
jgi:hypothetical protein